MPAEDCHLPLRTDPSLDMGPLDRYDHLTCENTRGMIDALHKGMHDWRIIPEMEVVNDGHLDEVHLLLERHELADPVYATLIFGGGTLTRPRPRNLLNAVSNLPDGAPFNTLASGRHQLPLTTMGIIPGGHVRVGSEDNVYYRKVDLATSNAQLVERTVRIANERGREVAIPDRARDILNL